MQQIIQEKSELPEKMYFENIDLVFQEENNRILTLDDYTENRNYKYKTILNTSKNFKTNVDSNNNLKFISINKQYPNSELREKFYYGVWYDDNTFIYSVKNKGIYMYNAENRTYATIIEGNNSFELIEVINNILYYDNTSIDLNI